MFQEKGGIFSGMFKKTPKPAEAARPEEVKVSFTAISTCFKCFNEIQLFTIIFLLSTLEGCLEVFFCDNV